MRLLCDGISHRGQPHLRTSGGSLSFPGLRCSLKMVCHRLIPQHDAIIYTPSGAKRAEPSVVRASSAEAIASQQDTDAEIQVVSTGASEPEDLEALAQRVVELERAAADAHTRAQELNKQGRFDEAQAMYAEMHALEDAASELTKRVGCVQCVLGAPPATDGVNSACTFDTDVLLQYSLLYRPNTWGAAAAARSTAAGYEGAGQQDAAAAAAAESTAAGNAGLGQQDAAAAAVRQRAEGAMLGGAVADAAAMGVHWVYDLDALAALEEEVKAQGRQGLEFVDPPRSPFYQYQSGRNSPYGEQTAVLLASLASCGGLDCGHYADALAERFGEGFDGYRDVSTKGFLRNYARAVTPPLTGAEDAQANCTARLAPLVAMFAGNPDLLQMVEMATRVTQNTDAACAWGCAGAAILEGVLLGLPPSEAVAAVVMELQKDGAGRFKGLWGLAAEVASQLRRALDLAASSPRQAVAELGRNCHMPNALTTPLQVVLHIEHAMAAAGQLPMLQPPSNEDAGSCSNGSSSAAEWYQLGVRLAIREGGCCASRAAYVGACLGGLFGSAAIPKDWLLRCLVKEELESGVAAICSSRDGA